MARRHGRRGSTCGFALFETLISLLVLSVGMTALIRMQTGLWRSVDLSRHRAQALRLAQADLERLRWYATLAAAPLPIILPGAPSPAIDPTWAGIASASADAIITGAEETAFTLTRMVTTLPGVTQVRASLVKAVATRLTWSDRSGAGQALELSTLIEANDPRWSAWMALDPGGAGAGAGVRAAPPGLPPSAQNLGDGRSALRPAADQAWVWIVDHQIGTVTQRCDAALGAPAAVLRPQDLSNCTAVSGLLLSGSVRFATHSAAVSAADAARPLGPALPLALAVQFSATPGAHLTCHSDAPTALPAAPTTAVIGSGSTAVRFACLVQTDNIPLRWSGRLDIVPSRWTLASSATDNGPDRFRVCRYSADRNGNGSIDAVEHPASYANVGTHLSDQNFLVIQAAARCPLDTAGLAAGVDYSTAAHQP